VQSGLLTCGEDALPVCIRDAGDRIEDHPDIVLADERRDICRGAQHADPVHAHALLAGAVVHDADHPVQAAKIGTAQQPGGELGTSPAAHDQHPLPAACATLAQVDPAVGQPGQQPQPVAHGDEAGQHQQPGRVQEALGDPDHRGRQELVEGHHAGDQQTGKEQA
jgi:hypothetical protein